MMKRVSAAVLVAVTVCSGTAALAQPPAAAPAPQGRGMASPAASVVSPEIAADRRVTFRIYAPSAQAVRLAAGDIQGLGQAAQLAKGENGVWAITVGPIDPGAYRYNFNVDGVTTIDPRNHQTSESNTNVWSLFYVPGSDFMDTKNVPRGAVAEVTYYSTALQTFRRMHVYTPPGYEVKNDKYPVFYLLHGAGDSDAAWSTVGRAGFILDNLIADKKAKPMVVVMPHGHTRRGPGGTGGRAGTEEFVNDFNTDVQPYVEKHYRVLTDRANTAIAGLSMGGNHTLQVAFPHLDRYAYIGVYSSGLLGGFPGMTGPGGRGAAPAPAAQATAPAAAPAPAGAGRGGGPPPMSASEWETTHAKMLDNPSLKKGVKLLWFATGKDDGLITTTQATVDMLKKHGFTPVFKETPGGHTWINWRDYLNEFAPQLFQ
jgi:enterochelin esterase family protein